MAPVVSILLPSIRPDLFRLRMQEYARLELPGPCEVVVVSDREDWDTTAPQPDLPIRHAVQPRQGNVPATNLAFAMATGTYVYATNDECELDPQALSAHVRAAETHGDGLFSTTQTPYCSNEYFGVFFANCPFGRKAFFQQLNRGDVLFDPIYHCFYADPDLSLRAHAVGFRVVPVPEAVCTHHCVHGADGHGQNWGAYYRRDRQTFATRWAHLGQLEKDPSVR